MKILKTIIPFSCILIFIYSFLSNEKIYEKQNNNKKFNNKTFKVIKKINFFNKNFYFESFYSTSKFSENVQDLRTPPRTKQLFFIYKKNKKIFIQIPTTIRYQKTNTGKKIKIVDIRIDELNFYKFKSDTCFRISGYGGCNSCNEFVGYYNLDGKIIYYSYRNKVKDIETIDNLIKPWDSLIFERNYIKKPFLNFNLDSVDN